MSHLAPTDNFLYDRRMALERFMNTYEKEYKKIKKVTHDCQAACYDKADYSRARAEDCARRCLQPYMMQRKINNGFMAKCEDNLQRDELQCRPMTGDQQKSCFKNVIDTFDQCLQDQAPKVKKCVSEYTKSFNDIVHGNENNK